VKICSKCKIRKSINDFGVCRQNKDGRRGKCKQCIAEYQRQYTKTDVYKRYVDSKEHKQSCKKSTAKWYINNLDTIKKNNKLKYINNRENELRRGADKYKKNINWCKKYAKMYAKKNRGAVNAKTAKYRAKKLNATIGNYDKELKEIYKYCPKDFHVDHVVPLQGKTVCGLHVPWNLQYLSAVDNIKKGNKFEQ